MTKKTLSGICAVFVAGILTIAAGVGSAVNGKWFQNSDIKTWFNGWGKDKQEIAQPDNPNTSDKPDDTYGGNLASIGNSAITETENYGISLLSAVIPREAYEANGISTQADSAYTLTAQYSPAGATDIWEWTITGNEDEAITLSGYGMSATVVCNKAFDVQKVITVASLSNPSVKASCTVDYYKRLEYVTVSVPEVVSLNNGTTDISVSLVPHYSKGTILDITVTMLGASIKTTYEDNQFGSGGYARSADGSEAIPTATVTGSASTGKISLIMSATDKSSFYTVRKGADHGGTREAYFKWFIAQCKLNSSYNHYDISVSWKADRGNSTFNTGTAHGYGKFDASGLAVNATNVSMSDTGLLF